MNLILKWILFLPLLQVYVYKQFHLLYFIGIRSRDCVWPAEIRSGTNSRPPLASGWSIIHESLRIASRTSSQSHPGVPVTIQFKSKRYGLEPGDGGVSCRIGGLHPLIAMTPIFTTNFWVAELQMEVPLCISVVFQLIKNWKQIGIGVLRIFALSILLAREQSTSSIVVEYLLEINFTPLIERIKNPKVLVK